MKTEPRFMESLTALHFHIIYIIKPTSVTARSTALVCGRFLAGIVGPNPGGIMDVCR